MNIWRPIDAQTSLIKRWLTKTRLERLSIILLDIGIVFLVYTPFSPEPPMIFAMSAMALIFGGVVAVIEANKESIDDDTC